MALYACRTCGATDSFESWDTSRTVSFITRIEDQDGSPSVVYSGESDEVPLCDSHRDRFYECSDCGSEALELDDLIRPDPLDGETHDEPLTPDPIDADLRDPLRRIVDMLAVGYGHQDDSVVTCALQMLATELGISEAFAEEVHRDMHVSERLTCANLVGPRR